MLRSMTNLLTYLAQHSSSLNENVLAHICRLGALEASKNDSSFPLPVVGIWDWDVAADLNHLDRHCSDLLGIDPQKGRDGVSNHACVAAVYSEDVPKTSRRLERATQ